MKEKGLSSSSDEIMKLEALKSANEALIGPNLARIHSIQKSMKRIDALNDIGENHRRLHDSLGLFRLYDAQKSISDSFIHLKSPMWESWRNESTRFKDMFASTSKFAEQAKLISHFSKFVPTLNIPNFAVPDFVFLSNRTKLGFLDSFNEQLSISKMLADGLADVAFLRDKKYQEILNSIPGDTKDTLSTSAYADLLEELNSRIPADDLGGKRPL